MLGLFRKARKATRSLPVRRVRLVLETLEDRDCPSGADLSSLALPDFGPVADGAQPRGDAPPPSEGDGGAPANHAPSLTLNITYGSQRMVTLSGQVTDEHPGGLIVSFSGVVDGFAVTNPDGTFSLEVEASSLGMIEASTVDALGLASNVAAVTVASNAPQLTEVSCSEGIDNIWTFRGKVIDESAPDLVVRFAGLTSLENRTVTVEADGWFCLIVQLQPDEEGIVSAITTDWWGQDSNTGYYTVQPT